VPRPAFGRSAPVHARVWTRARHPAPAALALAAVLAACLLGARPASALIRYDFEQKYFTHPGRQVWDFSIVRADGTYHIFYHTIPLANPTAVAADTIWHAKSPDLSHWHSRTPVLVTAAGSPWEQGASWAPAVERDEENNRWVMLYTGCDTQMNQRIGLATSPDLETWTRTGPDPVIVPDPAQYIWNTAQGWADFRDPFLYRQDGLWHSLVTAKKLVGAQPTGVLYHGTSPDLVNWTDVGPIFQNNSSQPGKVLESSQYVTIGSWQHLLFGVFDAVGITILSAADPAGWTMASARLLDNGYAPEVDTFDAGVHIFSRLANYQLPLSGGTGYVVRLDTLRTNADGSNPIVWKPHPLDADWIVRTGTATLGGPTFGDNPLYHSEPTSGLVGTGYFGSRDYYPGPLSGRGAPGVTLGDAVTGRLEGRPFTVTGNRIALLVGGGEYPNTCYAALVDASDGTILRSETGNGGVTMTPRQWLVGDLRGRQCRIVIVDDESGTGGFINVDQIEEIDDSPAAVAPDRVSGLAGLAIAPNPANPATRIAFALDRPGPVDVAVYDLRGRRVWASGPRWQAAGRATVLWTGVGADGLPVPSGAYLVRVTDDRGAFLSGRLTILK
jgi:beta-fructofuranosidase